MTMHPAAYKRFRSDLNIAMLHAKTGGGPEGGWLRIEQARSLIGHGELAAVEAALEDLVQAGLAERQTIDAAVLYRARGIKATPGGHQITSTEEALKTALRIIDAQDKLMAAYRSGSARTPAGAIDTLTRLRPQLNAFITTIKEQKNDE